MFLNTSLCFESGDADFTRGHCQRRTLEYHRNKCDCFLCVPNHNSTRVRIPFPRNAPSEGSTRMVKTKIFESPRKLSKWHAYEQRPLW